MTLQLQDVFIINGRAYFVWYFEIKALYHNHIKLLKIVRQMVMLHLIANQNDGLNETLNKVADTINDTINKGIDNRTIYPVKIKVRESMIKIVNFLLHNPGINSDQISNFIKRSVPTVERHLIALRKLNIVKHSGSKKTGGYYLTEETENKIKK